MEHDLNAFMIQSYLKHSAGTLTSPVSVDTVKTREIMDSVKTALVLIETFQPNFITKNGEKFIKVLTMIIVVKDLLFSVLSLLDVDYSHFELRLHKDLSNTPWGKRTWNEEIKLPPDRV